jgi:hypothetical protein
MRWHKSDATPGPAPADILVDATCQEIHRILETLKLIALILLLLVISLLPQAPGLAGYWLLKRANQWWASVMAIVLPPLIFFALVFVFIKHEQARLLPTEYWMVVILVSDARCLPGLRNHSKFYLWSGRSIDAA